MFVTKSPVLAAAAILLLSASAQAADLGKKKEPAPPPAPAAPLFDWAVGGKAMSDYISRGVTQSNHQPAVTAYGELRFNVHENFQLYAGGQLWSVKLPTNPAVEADIFAGVRPTFGPFAFDFGAIWYAYLNNTRQYFIDGTGVTFLTPVPGGVPTTAKNPGWGEIYGKASYTWNDMVTVGANVFYAPNWTNVGADATYVSGTLKVNLPNNFYVSGEFGRQFLGTSKAAYGPTKYVSYNTWNAGVGYTYKIATLDLRYSGTDLTRAQCWINTSDPRGNPVGVVANGRSSWCGHRFVATLSVDISGKDLK
ncbi:MAG: hypothetical protein JNK46_01015 [Methylobacteriaceae bacterium]|nr:hypothetical protein [Methylobacteriaceae bacterium]